MAVTNVNKRKCLNCGKKLYGRLGKMFCNDSCRNEYHNRNKYNARQQTAEQRKEAIRLGIEFANHVNHIGDYDWFSMIMPLKSKPKMEMFLQEKKHFWTSAEIIEVGVDYYEVQFQYASISGKTTAVWIISADWALFNTKK